MVDTEAKRDPEDLLAHAGWVRGLVRALVLDPGQVDDVVQQTYLAALERPPHRVLDPRAWLGGVARNLARDANRRDVRREQREQRSARREQLPSAEDLVAKAELQREVVKAVVELDEPYRSTLLLRFFEDLSAEQIAAREGVPGSTVRNRLKRGLDRLRERFDREHGGDRRAWALGLLPLVRTGGAEGAPPVPAAASAATTGGSSMIAKIWIGAAAAAAALGGGTAVYVLRGEDLGPAAAETTAELAAPLGESAEESESAPASAAGLAAPGATRTVAPLGVPAAGLSGTVLDTAGAAVEGAEVFVGGWSDLFGDGASVAVFFLRGERAGRIQRRKLGELRQLPPDVLELKGVMVGRVLATDAEGRFGVPLPVGTRAHVRLARSFGLEPTEDGAWYAAPATELALTAERVPTATALVRVLDETTSEYLRSFRGGLLERAAGGRERDHRAIEAEDGVARVGFELRHGPATYHLRIVEPPWAEGEEEFTLVAGQTREIVLRAVSGAGFSGEVTDAFGRPVEDALVFWGEPSRMREGGKTGRPFEPQRVPDAVRTDTHGRFRLPGNGEVLSAWHGTLSPASIEVAGTSTLVLPPRGAIFGTAFDEHGEPAAGEKVGLDRRTWGTTGPDGSWRIEGVEAGAHELFLPGKRMGTAIVTAGEDTEVDPLWLGDVSVALVSGGRPYTESFRGVVVGSGSSFRLVREFGAKGGTFTLWRAIPDRYWIISHSGRIAEFAVAGPSGPSRSGATLELGDADLTVHAPAGERVYVLPENAGEPLAYWARRISIEVPDSGSVTWSPLARGTWRVGTHDTGVLATVEVEGPGAEVTLP